MVKIFFAGIAIIVLVVVGAFAAVFGPLMTGVDRNLGGNPKMPFHSPVPQPVADAIRSLFGHVTPSLALTVVIALVALLLIYTVGALVGHSVRRWRERRDQLADLRRRGRPMGGKNAPSTVQPTTSKAEFESMWK